jgi:hypothetical protein
MDEQWVMPLRFAYRDWLFNLARQEAESGCPRLRATKSEMAMYFTDLTERWGAEARYNLMCARIKWLFARNYGYPPIPVTEQETAAEAQWTPWSQAVSRSTRPWNPSAAEIRRAVERHKEEERGAYNIDKPALKKALSRSMTARFGKGSGIGAAWYTTQIGDLTVTTQLDFSVRRDQFEYLQHVKTRKQDLVLRHGGVLTLLGWPQTRWGRLTNDDIPATAELVPRLCAEFIDAVPEMWDRSGLANKPPPEDAT